jgi:Porin subfamily
MKVGKRLLLASAASLTAVGWAQAADLPVKAKPVEYVKICTLYGEGFYYIPGSDTCLKLGGYIRAQYGWNVAGGRNPAYSGTQGAQDRTVSQFSTWHRANLQLDTRTQTAYGTLRTFTSLHFQQEDQTFSQNVARAFIQWAGFTFGHAQSFSDTWNINDAWHYATQHNNSFTGGNGVNQIAYTWELGNGMTLTVGADEVRRKSLTNLSQVSTIRVGAEPVTAFAGQKWPDAHIDFKINQAWGYWATSFIAHDVEASYYSCLNGTGGFVGTQPLTTTCGHPSDKVGWAIDTGAEFKLDFISPGDHIGFAARYGVGAAGYSGGSNLASPGLFGSGNEVAVGWMTDGVFTNLGGASPSIQLTTAWTVMAAYEHYWTPNLKTSISGGYTEIHYNGTAKTAWANAVCGGVGNPGVPLTNTPTAAPNTTFQGGFNGVGSAFCDPDWAYFQGGVRTQWNVSGGFYMGVEVLYTHIFTAFKGATANVNGFTVGATNANVTLIQPVSGARPNGIYRIDDQGSVALIFRAQRAFGAGD